MLRRICQGLLVGTLVGCTIHCGAGDCIDGREGCACTVQGTCDDGLRCTDTKCVADDDTTGADTSSSSSGTTVAESTASATTAVESGEADTSSESGPVVPCGAADVRITTYNVQAIGEQGSDQWNALGSILARIEPDVVCIEELEDFETAPMRALAESLGWGEPIQADPSPAIGGELRNACLGPRTMNRIASYTGSDLAPDGNANDVSRDFLAVRVDLDDGCHVNVIAIHAKSGQEDIDRFRRQVEYVRVGQALAMVRAEHPGEPVVLMGDFNENPDDPMLGQVFDAVPAGLPESYRLGADIGLPLTYDPFATVEAAGMTRLDPTAEDSTRMETWGVSGGFDGVRLDYIWIEALEHRGSIVYDACLDDGVDAPPAGAFLPLVGEPPPCAASEMASDHLPIVADLHVP